MRVIATRNRFAAGSLFSLLALFLIFPPVINPAYSFEDMFVLVSNLDTEKGEIEKGAPSIDGIFTEGEWDGAYETSQSYEEGEMKILAMHDADYIYIMLTLVNDLSEDAADTAYVCFDTDHDGGESDENDYCFSVNMLKEIKTLTGIETAGIGRDWKEQNENPEGLEASSGLSSVYSENPHAIYEFKVPLVFLGHSDEYGFYAVIIDGKSNKKYAVPDLHGTTEDVPPPYDFGLLLFLDSGNIFDVKPKLSNGDIIHYLIDQDTKSLFMLLSTDEEKDGEMEITLPRALIDSKVGDQDIEFVVLVDGHETPYEEIANTPTERTIRFPVIHQSLDVEIQGTEVATGGAPITVVPEFQSLSVLSAITAVTLLGLILSARRSFVQRFNES